MEIYNEITINCNSSSDARNAKQIVADSIMSLVHEDYHDQHLALAVEALKIKNRKTLTTNGLAFLSEDLIKAFTKIVKALAEAMPTAEFTFSAHGEDTYTESFIKGSYTDGSLEINTIFYPEGFAEFFTCPECGEALVRYDECDPSKPYVCAECGETVDLHETYNNCSPVRKDERITIC